MSEMCLKMGFQCDFERNTSKNTGYQENCTINEPTMLNFQDSFTNLY